MNLLLDKEMNPMRKPKIYIDTSVISVLENNLRPEWTVETMELWDDIINGLFIPIISDITYDELDKCPEHIKDILYNYIAQVDAVNIDETEESIELAGQYINHGVLSEKNRDDCRHIALATISDVDYIVSWNFKHFVNVRVINMVQAVNRLNGYKEVRIISPQMLGGYHNE